MNHKVKRYAEEQRQKNMDRLMARVALLKEKGQDPKQMAKDTQVRKLKAEIRQANARLRAVAASEELNAKKIQLKQEKAEAAKLAPAEEEKPAKKKPEKPVKKEKKAKQKAEAPAGGE
jgi:hypothetical protein